MSQLTGFSRLLNLLPHVKKQSKSLRHTGPAADRWTTRLSFESLERREMMATTPVVFTVPPDVAGRGVQVAIYGTLDTYNGGAYVNNQGTSISNGSLVYYNHKIVDYDIPTAASDLTFDLVVSSNQATVNIEQVGITAGEIVIGVAGPLSISYSNSTISVPTSSTEPNGYFGLFEYSVTPNGTNTVFNWNIDLSLIDQIGFPFTISADTPVPDAVVSNGVGIKQHRGDLFNLYPEYIAQMATYNGNAAAFQQNFLYGDGYRILATQNLVTGNPAPTQNSLKQGKLGRFAPNTTFNYWVTATSATGETTFNGYTSMVTKQSTKATVKASASLSWNPIDGATGYKVYRGTSSDPSQSQLIYTATSAATLTYKDKGAAGTTGTPPANSYTFNPLNSYFNDTLDDFFTHYETDTFSITANFHGTVWSTFTGNTVTNYQIGGSGPLYTVLQLTTTDPYYSGQEFLVFKPYFSNNTNIIGAPPAPSWMQNTSNSPGWMVFACDGVFATGGVQPGLTADGAVALNGIENSIVSALNRGIATNFSIAPDVWINYPDVTGASATPGSGLNPDTYYYYVVTAVSNGNESPASVEFAAQTTSANSQITITWEQEDVYNATTNPHGVDSYNVYRSTTPGTGYVKIANVTNPAAPPVSSYTDASLTTLTGAPELFYEPGTISNWYAAFTHLNHSTNPISGVSVSGLGYGFPYDDQGNFSSDFTAYSPTQINIELMAWTNRTTVPDHPATNPLPAPPTSPVGVTIYKQPVIVKVGVTNSVSFKAYTAQGHSYFGGALVQITLINSQGLQTSLGSVTTDPLTGEATYKFTITISGKYQLKFTLADGHQNFSSIFQVIPSNLKGKKLKK